MKNRGLHSIGEVAKMVGVEIHTIRFWTDEFSEYIKFELGKGERRYYPTEAIEVFNRINALIHTDGIRIKMIKEKKLLLNNMPQKSRDLKEKLAILKGLLIDAKLHLERQSD